MTLPNLILGGFLGTIVMSIMIVYGYMMQLMPPSWSMISDGLGGMMNEMMGMPKMSAWGVHFMIGTLIHPLVYDYLWVGILKITLGSYLNEIVYAMIFAIMMIAMLGMMKAPREWWVKMSIGILMAHIVYALILAYFDVANFI